MLRLAGVSYAQGREVVLSGVSLHVAAGERVAVVGANGSGKSTVARLANGSLAPCEGIVEAEGFVGLVGQDPGSSITTTLVDDDVAFGPRCLGLRGEELRERVEGALARVGAVHLCGRDATALSGGEQQRVSLAAAMACNPAVLVLDEVTSQLDAAARAVVRRAVVEVLRQGTGILELTHRAEELVGADRVLLLNGGHVAWEGSPGAFFGDAARAKRAGVDGPLTQALGLLARAGVPLGRLCSEGQLNAGLLASELRERGLAHEVAALLGAPFSRERAAHGMASHSQDDGDLVLSHAHVSYGGREAVRDASLRVRPGSVCVVAGPSGSGKSSVARMAAGVLAPDGGTVALGGRPVRPGEVPLALQSPQTQLFAATVLQDVQFGPLNQGATVREARAAACRALGMLGVDERLWDRSPFELSGGEQRRVALAGVVAMSPGAYVLDEPTAGLDGRGRSQAVALARGLADAGAAVLVVTHDLWEWLAAADEVVLMEEGRTYDPQTTGELLGGAWPASCARRPLELALLEALNG